MLKTFKGNDTQVYAMHDGFVTVENDKILVLSETCENRMEINLKRAQASKERAEKRLAELSNDDINYRRAEIALKRAISRINTASSN
jgi:F-type H+-transporting ATPase subunit epsilon